MLHVRYCRIVDTLLYPPAKPTVTAVASPIGAANEPFKEKDILQAPSCVDSVTICRHPLHYVALSRARANQNIQAARLVLLVLITVICSDMVLIYGALHCVTGVLSYAGLLRSSEDSGNQGPWQKIKSQ